MDYVDATLVQLADETVRAGLFDQEALEQLVSAAYDAGTIGATGPFSPIFDELELGVAADPLGSLEGAWNVAGGAERTEARFRLFGFPHGTLPRIDALWRGSILARFALAGEPITAVDTTITDDKTIQAEITFAAPQPVSATAKPLPIAAAVLIRDAPGLSIAQLLTDSKAARARLRPLGIERSPEPTLRLREPLPIVWIVPEGLFDDPGWPGAAPGMSPAAARAARRTAAGAWLAREGIGLVVTS